MKPTVYSWLSKKQICWVLVPKYELKTIDSILCKSYALLLKHFEAFVILSFLIIFWYCNNCVLVALYKLFVKEVFKNYRWRLYLVRTLMLYIVLYTCDHIMVMAYVSVCTMSYWLLLAYLGNSPKEPLESGFVCPSCHNSLSLYCIIVSICKESFWPS